MKFLYVIPLTFIIIGCSAGNNKLTLDSSTGELVLENNLHVNNISNNSFDVSVGYTGDSNSDVTLFYCNNTDSPGCTPAAPVGTLIETESLYYVQVNNSDLNASDNPGDELTLRIESSNSNEPTQNKQLTLTTSAVTHQYRSIGPSNTTALTTGVSNKLSITNNIATFESSLADNIGVGDVIQYDSTGDSTVDTIAFIYSRLSNTTYLVKNISGSNPLAVTNDNDWSIYRAYTSLQDAEEGDENLGIDASLRNFETWASGNDIVTSNSAWHFAFYADAIDTTAVTFNSWTLSETNYMRVFAPKLKTDVGVNQRHAGLWDNTKATLSVTDTTALYVLDEHITITGLQVEGIITGSIGSQSTVRATVSESFTFKNNIVKGSHTSTGLYNHGLRVYTNVVGGIAKISNNLVYDYNGSPSASGIFISGNGTTHVYNNTVFGGNEAYYTNANTYLFNNIAQGNSSFGFRGSSHPSSDHNFSDFADAPGLNSVNSATLTFSDLANDNFNLAETDITAIDTGIDLSNDPVHSITDDLTGNIRIDLWEMGAFSR